MERLIQWIYRTVFGIEIRFASPVEKIKYELDQIDDEIIRLQDEWEAKRDELDRLLIAEEIDPAGCA